jgi:hypothetical protein
MKDDILNINYKDQNNFNYLYSTDKCFVGYMDKLTKKERELIGAKLVWKRKEKKYTAVEWLKQLMNDYVDKNKDKFILDWDFVEQLFKEAKELEKKQIFKALQAGVNIEISDGDLTYKENFIKYYKKYE